MTTFLFSPQGFVFQKRGDMILVWPLTCEAANWLHLTTEALWPERSIYFNGALVVKRGDDWSELFMQIYHAGWRWSDSFWSQCSVRPVGFNGGGRHGPPLQV